MGSEAASFCYADMEGAGRNITRLIDSCRFCDAEVTIQSILFKYPENCYFLKLLGYVYEKREKYLEANDAYGRAFRNAETVRDKEELDNCVNRIADLIRGKSFSKADYAKSLYKVASIYCYGRSGTHFFKSLLDNHPETIVTMLNGIKILNLWNSEIKDNINDLSCECIAEKIFDALHTEFNDGIVYDEPRLNGMYVMGENRDEFYSINKDKFKTEFIEIMDGCESADAGFFYQAVQLSASYALGRSYDFLTGIPVIVEGGIHFSTHTDLTQQLLNIFPYTRLFHMVRNPISSLASTVKSLAVSGIGNINLLCSNLVILLHKVPATIDWADRTYLVRLEDLHTKSRETLQLVCSHLGIRWSDTLLESTFGGIKWWNTTTSDVISGFNTQIISKKHDDILSSFDRFRFESMLRTKFKSWGYDSFDFFDYDILKKLLEYPFKFEGLFSKSKDEFDINRKIICRTLLKYLKEEQNPEDERIRYEVHLLSPGCEGEI